MTATAQRIEVEAKPVKPFLRWTGGKAKLVPELLKLAPKTFNKYWEPFLGGGAFFFALHPLHAELSDANEELIHAYKTVRDQHLALIVALQKTARVHSKEHYLQVRALDPKTLDPVLRAARFIYLNRTAFNGLYRVNKSGQFNVSWDPDRSGDAEEHKIACAHDALRGYGLLAHDFREIEAHVYEGDFVYADPPYVSVSKTADFTAYTADGFTHQDQIDLRDTALRFKRRGVHVLLSNSATRVVEALYGADFELHPVTRQGTMNSKASERGAVKEYIIR